MVEIITFGCERERSANRDEVDGRAAHLVGLEEESVKVSVEVGVEGRLEEESSQMGRRARLCPVDVLAQCSHRAARYCAKQQSGAAPLDGRASRWMRSELASLVQQNTARLGTSADCPGEFRAGWRCRS